MFALGLASSVACCGMQLFKFFSLRAKKGININNNNRTVAVTVQWSGHLTAMPSTPVRIRVGVGHGLTQPFIFPGSIMSTKLAWEVNRGFIVELATRHGQSLVAPQAQRLQKRRWAPLRGPLGSAELNNRTRCHGFKLNKS